MNLELAALLSIGTIFVVKHDLKLVGNDSKPWFLYLMVAFYDLDVQNAFYLIVQQSPRNIMRRPSYILCLNEAVCMERIFYACNDHGTYIRW